MVKLNVIREPESHTLFPSSLESLIVCRPLLRRRLAPGRLAILCHVLGEIPFAVPGGRLPEPPLAPRLERQQGHDHLHRSAAARCRRLRPVSARPLVNDFPHCVSNVLLRAMLQSAWRAHPARVGHARARGLGPWEAGAHDLSLFRRSRRHATGAVRFHARVPGRDGRHLHRGLPGALQAAC